MITARKTLAAFAIAAFALAAFIALPQLSAQTSGAFSLVDALGRTVKFDKTPTRIVMTNKAVAMLANAAYLFPEASSRIVAMSTTKQGKYSFVAEFDPSVSSKILLDSQSGPEQVAAAKPDAVVLKTSLAGGLGKSIESLGIPVVYLDLEKPEQFERDIGILGKLFRNEARAQTLTSLFTSKMEKITKVLAGLGDAAKPKVLMLYYTDQGGAVSFNVPPLGWIQTSLVVMGGGIPVWSDAKLGSGWTKVSVEQVAAWNPDKIFVISYTADPAAVIGQLTSDPQWAGLRAVKQGGLLPFPGDFYSWDQADVRWPLGLAWVAKTLHPELLAGLDLKAEVRAFYKDFYGMGDADFARLVTPKLPAELR